MEVLEDLVNDCITRSTICQGYEEHKQMGQKKYLKKLHLWW